MRCAWLLICTDLFPHGRWRVFFEFSGNFEWEPAYVLSAGADLMTSICTHPFNQRHPCSYFHFHLVVGVSTELVN